jgi:hypothetical protein
VLSKCYQSVIKVISKCNRRTGFEFGAAEGLEEEVDLHAALLVMREGCEGGERGARGARGG